MAPKQPTTANTLASTTTDAATAIGMTVDSLMLRALLLALGEDGEAINECDWTLERIRVNDTGLLHQGRNSWLDPTKRWEVAFFLPQRPCIRRVQFEGIKGSRPRALKPTMDDGKKGANHRRWMVVCRGASNLNPRDYLGLVRTLPH